MFDQLTYSIRGNFRQSYFPVTVEPDDEALKHRQTFIDAVINEIGRFSNQLMIIHDHFDGSAHCVECGSECQLTGDNLLATALIRYLFEEWAFSGRYPNMMITKAVKDTGIDFERFKQRAKETNL